MVFWLKTSNSYDAEHAMNKHDEYLFVYGTLCKRAIDSRNSLLQPQAHFISEATLQAQLYMVDYYPAIIDSDQAGDRVIGELYRITQTETLFEKLDEYEGCSPQQPQPHEYRREQRKVRINSGEASSELSGELVSAWIYIFNLPIKHFVRIESGDFLIHQKEILNIPEDES